MATLNSQLTVIISYVPTYVTGVTGISNSLNGTNSTWPNGLPDMIKTYSGGWYKASYLDPAFSGFGYIVGTGADYVTALNNFMLSATSSALGVGNIPEHRITIS